MKRIAIAWKALAELGYEPVALNSLYKLGLRSGHYRRVTAQPPPDAGQPLQLPLPLPERKALAALIGAEGEAMLQAEAEEIAAGRVRLFGAEAALLRLALPGVLPHWTAYETGRVPLPLEGLLFPDVKFLWEPARFGWAFTLGRAYLLSGDECYPQAFWQFFETFADANPPYRGPHWMNGQEVALRLMALAWADRVLRASPASTAERRRRLAATVAAHAARIPPTLVYARSQQNNHLLTEAAGLFTAGLALPGHPAAAGWRALGWRWFEKGLQMQVDANGEYIQHSANYQRLMLQAAMWMHALLGGAGEKWSHASREALMRAAHWMLALLDEESGGAPNLGANDGACIFPLSSQPFEDYRPVAHAAARAFLDYDLPAGPWDEMALWFGVLIPGAHATCLNRYLGDQIYAPHSWAFLRTAQFDSRPTHADQLHLDLWWRGVNIARDAGTFLYNTPPPWDNVLTTALVHNTVTVNGRDQMSRAGRFLYLDWADAWRRDEIATEVDVLQRIRGVFRCRSGHYRHTRTVQVAVDETWSVTDDVIPLRFYGRRRAPWHLRLHWLLPDWEWELQPMPAGMGQALRLLSPHGWLTVRLQALPDGTAQGSLSLVRAGQVLLGQRQPLVQEGWFSPTYGVRQAALAISLETDSPESSGFLTTFTFPAEEPKV